MKVWLKLEPGVSVPELKASSCPLDVTVCNNESISSIHVTVSPIATVKLASDTSTRPQ